MRSFTMTLILGLAALTLEGCASKTPYLDSRFGNAVNAAKAQQTINPRASLNPDPVSGIDGTAATESIGRYNDSFRAPPPTFEIFFGTAGGDR
jgi:type IV pilus biogenesis protein CpaD/CtpE